MKNLVDCDRCLNWSLMERMEEACSHCNNTGKIIDPKEILCNLCGECMCPLETMNKQIPHGLYNAKVIGGYDSYHLLDMNHYIFSLCEKCLRQIFDKCKIPPTVKGYNDNTSYDYSDDKEFYDYRVWKDRGGHHDAYLKGKCNFAKDCLNDAIYSQLINDTFTEGCCCEEHKRDWNYTNSKLIDFVPNNLKPFL